MSFRDGIRNDYKALLTGEADEPIELSFEDFGESEADPGDSQPLEQDPYFAKWNWIVAIDSLAKEHNITWEQVTDLPIINFLNKLSFLHDKNKHNQQEYEKQMKANSR